MSVSAGFIEHVKEMLAGLGAVGTRRMFSGAGVYCDGVIFGLVIDDVLYLKSDEQTRASYLAEGCGPFAYDSKVRRVETSYWRVPERLFDDPDEMETWARDALAVAQRSAASKAAPSKARKAKRKPEFKPKS